MGTVIGAFPFINHKKMVIRSPMNPIDKCTVVSIFPREVKYDNPTIQPGKFTIPAGSFEEPAVLVVGSSSWFKEMDDGQPDLEIPQTSIQVANSIVMDDVNSRLFSSYNEACPGLFYVQGTKSVLQVKTSHKEELETARLKQIRWYEILIKQGDALWARSSGNPLAIDDTMRLACKELGKDKPWLKDFTHVDLVNCKACGALINPLYPVCRECKAINNESKAKELGIRFAV